MTFPITPEIEYRIARVREHLKSGAIVSKDSNRIAEIDWALKIAIEDVEFLLDLVENFIPPPPTTSAVASTTDTPTAAPGGTPARLSREPAKTPTS